MSVVNGVVSVGTTATKICTMGPTGALVMNTGSVVVYLGGPGVTASASAATGGVSLPATMTSPVAVPGGPAAFPGAEGTPETDDLYGITASSSANVGFLTNA